MRWRIALPPAIYVIKIHKLKVSGISDEKAVQTICNKEDSFSSAYLSEMISCLADLRFEKEEWANKMAKKFIDYTEAKEFAFKNDTEYINWLSKSH
ncbi:unnamed protein product [Blepharisma stoltei]|uniref:Uncharacterized protein n=1 Tax=Blepharisma stoltei TaxID=1481888 RepID=A0AAU9KB23_9CILI|nr:unnamed protein product [Blepharisma stoltei]